MSVYLHIGQDSVVRFSDIVGIFDIDTSSLSPLTREFLAKAQKEGRVVDVTPDLPKSFIVCNEDTRRRGPDTVYISQISSTTLLKRTAGGGELPQESPGPD